jgi:hypothetical protein
MARVKRSPRAIQPICFVHMETKHLPKLQDCDRVSHKRYLYVAIDRASRYVHLAVKDDDTTASDVAFLNEALGAFFFKVTHVLSARGSCFAADAFEAACAQHRKTKRRAVQRPGAAGGAGHHPLQPPAS